MTNSSSAPAPRAGMLYIVGAPSGAGKTSLLAEVQNREPSLMQAVTTTTRPMREGEVNGEHYHFITHQDFAAKVEAGAFLEHAVVFGNRYGLTYEAVRQPLADGRDVLVILDVQGAESVMKAMPENVVSIFILPPSFSEMRKRLSGRGQNNEADTTARINGARDEIAACAMFNYLVVNDDFETTVQDIQAIIRYYRLNQQKPDILGNLVPSFFNT